MSVKRLPLLLLAGLVLLALLVVSQQPAALADPGASIVAWWSMDETSGNRADSTGSYDLTDVNTVGSTTGLVGNAASFDSANSEYLSSATFPDCSDRDFSIIGWVRIVDTSLTQRIFSNFGGAGSRSLYLRNVGGALQVLISSDGTASTSRGLGSSVDNTWHFVYFYHDSVNDEIGGSVDDGSVLSSAYSGGCYGSGSPWYVGGESTSQNLTGDVDELVWYDQVLSAADVTYLYNGGAGRAYADVASPPTATPTITSTPTETPTPTNTPVPTNTPTPGPLVYTVPLPSGGNGQVMMSASAGELIAGGVGVLLATLVIFYLVRDMAFMGVKK